MRRFVIGAVAIIIGLWIVSMPLFTVDEGDQVIITQFGDYVRTVATPGLHAKMPLIQTLKRFDKRVLAADAAPAE